MAMDAKPQSPASSKAADSRARAQSDSSTDPAASPTNAKAAHGKIGNSHDCGVPNVCTPSMYDSSHHVRECGRQVVHNGGVKMVIAAAQTTAVTAVVRRNR